MNKTAKRVAIGALSIPIVTTAVVVITEVVSWAPRYK